MKPTSEEDRLLKQADLSRARLLAVVDLLDQKREELTHPLRMISKRMPKEPLLYIAIGAVAVTLTGTIGYLVAQRNRRVDVRVKKRVARYAPPTPAQSFWGEVASRSAKALITFAIARAGKLAINGASHQLEERALAADPI